MLTYLRSMEAFSLSLPNSWTELSDHQLYFFFRQVARDLPMNEVLPICVCKWAYLVVLCRVDKHRFLIRQRYAKKEGIIFDWQLAVATRNLAFLESFPASPVRLTTVQGAEAVPADLQGVSFEDYLALENLYQGFLHTQSLECLTDMTHLLYPALQAKASLPKEVPLSVFYWFASVKGAFARLYPNFFSSVPDDDSNLLGSDPRIGEQLRQAMNAQIRALTGGDITKEEQILQMDCHRALTELDAKAREAEEMRKQMG